MATMIDADRISVRRIIAQRFSKTWESCSITKAELKAGVDAIDQYLSDNEVAINNALPAAAKAGLTKQQKAQLLMFVTAKRYEVDI